MPSDYAAIRADNERRYGTDIGRIGQMLLSDRYGERTHFIYEVLQNAEDALAKRGEWSGSRAVHFSLSSDGLEISHFGRPFDEADVRGICGIALSTKGLTSIGRFGIGFKSVYSFTDSPEIHSDGEHFAIDSYVWPRAISERVLQPEETRIRLPFREDVPHALEHIQIGLQRLDHQTLLFLREIDEISWSVEGGPSGLYLRNKPEPVGKTARKVVVIGEDQETDYEEQWLIFSRSVSNHGEDVGYVEIAFCLKDDINGEGLSVLPIAESRLVVFFPTILPTNLGFLVQGPYRTTPSRDNVPADDEWNRYLVRETSILLVDALRELREVGLLNVSALQSLPLDASRFPEGSMFAPLFFVVQEALTTEPLLPCYEGGHTPAQDAKLARTQDLRELISSQQLASLFDFKCEINWLSGEITADRTPDVRTYLIEELNVDEVIPGTLIRKLTKNFLEAQPDEWVEQLYIFLSGQRTLLRMQPPLPLVRIEDGSHVVAYSRGQPQAFLPGRERTGFPTVRRRVCQAEEALAFLGSLGLSLPDPVDNVIVNVLPRYNANHPEVSDSDYRLDIESMLAAFNTDSEAQRQKLESALRNAKFVRAVDTGDGSFRFVRPAEVYQATQRLKGLFANVLGILIVDDSRAYLRGESIRALLAAVGSPSYLIPIEVNSILTEEQKRLLRQRAGNEDITHEIAVQDYSEVSTYCWRPSQVWQEMRQLHEPNYSGKLYVMFKTDAEQGLSKADTVGCGTKNEWLHSTHLSFGC